MVLENIIVSILTFILQEVWWIAFSFPFGIICIFALGIFFEKIYGPDTDFWDDFSLFMYHPLGNALGCLFINLIGDKNKLRDMIFVNLTLVAIHAVHLLFRVRKRYFKRHHE